MQPHKGAAMSSSINKGDRTVDGQIDYGRVFVTFTRHTEQKIAHGLIFESLLHALKARGVVLKDGEPSTLVDLGCGEGHTAYEMIEAINRVHRQSSILPKVRFGQMPTGRCGSKSPNFVSRSA
jgi:hypothetical protein